MWKRVKRLVRQAGIKDKRVTLHTLRHSIATHLLENGMSVEYVRVFLGHSCLESTQLYTRIVTPIHHTHDTGNIPPAEI